MEQEEACLLVQPHLEDHGVVAEENHIPYASSCGEAAGLVTCGDDAAAVVHATEKLKSVGALDASTWTTEAERDARGD